ncbi:TetR/AcrR family transcriptional regulator [Mucilaginibacter paludis]|uniref:Transcriptional regulator, TetR family n=1 Tax=Mucilaginibacter paludis DSM 18603 TaxID=714943 RepID=H1Y573_9SPHI|nr:TetR/AcrR family transcriptional regulator [Mucilaginibacter paludis]EHQ28616.1 transcriptional regulator, TetR family [Mucilaginibacter paludis DSM 18603]
MNIAIDPHDIKKERILDSAYNRFLHYGYSKTTMNEIAGDVSMSKALLYYYFPDKSQLYVAVMRKLANSYLKKLTSNSDGFHNLEEAFIFQIDTQHDFIVTNYNFFDFFRLNEQNLPDAIWEIIEELHSAEIELLRNAIVKEAKKKVIRPVENPEAIADILLDALHGVRVRAVSQKKKFFPGKDQLEEIHQKRLLLVNIFVRGLTS